MVSLQTGVTDSILREFKLRDVKSLQKGLQILNNQAFILKPEGALNLKDVISITVPIRVFAKVIWVSDDGDTVAAKYIPSNNNHYNNQGQEERATIPSVFLVSVAD